MPEPFFEDSHTTIWQGDCREVLKALPERSVQCVVCSPPYWGLRDYKLPASVWGGAEGCAHEWGEMERGKRSDLLPADISTSTARLGTYDDQRGALEGGRFCRLCGAWRGTLGLEPTPELYVEHMVAVFREVRRVLRDDGTVWLNLGDSYAGSASQGGYSEKQASNRGAWHNEPRPPAPGLKPKDLVGVPWRVAFALQADGWWLRSDIVWAKPNPMPESVTDRPTRSHEYVFLLAKRERYFYDADAIREPHLYAYNVATWAERKGKGEMPSGNRHIADFENGSDGRPKTPDMGNPAGRNKRTVWEIATQPYPEAHFATFPEALVRPCVLAGTSERGACAECGAPWERVVEPDEGRLSQLGKGYHDHSDDLTQGMSQEKKMPQPKGGYITTGWRPTCDCFEELETPRGEAYTQAPESAPCVVLDPFGGSGTVAVVARKAGRRAVLVELSEEYCELARDRIRQGVLI